MGWGVEYTNEFNTWWEELTADEQDAVARVVSLLEANKTGDDRFYELYVPLADAIYDEHLRELEAEKQHEP